MAAVNKHNSYNLLLCIVFARFEFNVSIVELHRRTLDVAVKNGGGLLSKHKVLLGKVTHVVTYSH